jgi:hypothetical protein
MKKQHYLIFTLSTLLFIGCTDPLQQTTLPTTPNYQAPQTQQPKATNAFAQATPTQQDAYASTMRKIASGIQSDPNYHRIALDTPEKKAWFRDLTYRLWNRDIDKQSFIRSGLQRYPTHRYEFLFIIRGLEAQNLL